jgi:hypothetical protein
MSAADLMGRAVRAMRAAGVTVVEVPGYATRGWKDRTFTPTAVVWHHDASPPGDSPGVPTWMAEQLDGTGNGAHWWVSRSGVWWAVAALWCPHTGAVLPGMPDNDNAWGVETDHTTGEEWPTAQLVSMRRGTAVLLDVIGEDVTALHMHKTICKPKGRKVDPFGIELDDEREAVRRTRTEDIDMTPEESAQLSRIETALKTLTERKDATGGFTVAWPTDNRIWLVDAAAGTRWAVPSPDVLTALRAAGVPHAGSWPAPRVAQFVDTGSVRAGIRPADVAAAIMDVLGPQVRADLAAAKTETDVDAILDGLASRLTA